MADTASRVHRTRGGVIDEAEHKAPSSERVRGGFGASWGLVRESDWEGLCERVRMGLGVAPDGKGTEGEGEAGVASGRKGRGNRGRQEKSERTGREKECI
jgi:hypothetical protein